MTEVMICGDVAEVCASLEEAEFDAVLCDPPYALNFMGKGWDAVMPPASTWASVLRVMKPGAFLLAFGGTRTFHRLTCAIEDAGFEIRDCVCWLYGQGFPKSLDISKAVDKAKGGKGELGGPRTAAHAGWIERGRMRGEEGHEGFQRPWMEDPSKVDAAAREYLPATDDARRWTGYGTALKPAWEPCIVAMKPIEGTFAENAIAHGVAGVSIDACRVGDNPGYKYRADINGTTFHGDQGKRVKQTAEKRGAEFIESSQGRWPANVMLDEEAASELDAQSGIHKDGVAVNRNRGATRPSIVGFTTGHSGKYETYGGSGGASRFFYTAKVSSAERNLGLLKGVNKHPTLKPLRLCEYLARLVLPPPHLDGSPRRILVPFSGAGSEVIGAARAGWEEVWGIEREQEYVDWANARIGAATRELCTGDSR